MDKISKFEEWYNNNYLGTEDDPNYNLEQSKAAWVACKKSILKELKGFEGEYVCDVIEKIKNI